MNDYVLLQLWHALLEPCGLLGALKAMLRSWHQQTSKGSTCCMWLSQSPSHTLLVALDPFTNLQGLPCLVVVPRDQSSCYLRQSPDSGLGMRLNISPNHGKHSADGSPFIRLNAMEMTCHTCDMLELQSGVQCKETAISALPFSQYLTLHSSTDFGSPAEHQRVSLRASS